MRSMISNNHGTSKNICLKTLLFVDDTDYSHKKSCIDSGSISNRAKLCKDSNSQLSCLTIKKRCNVKFPLPVGDK